MKLNKYLKELGYKWEDLPGNYNPAFDFGDCPASDPRNEEDEEGFCGYEFFSLDHSLALYIYPRLCLFREYCADFGTPGCFCHNKDGSKRKDGHERWIKELDKMILAFKYILKAPEEKDNKTIERTIKAGLKSFAKYYSCLWY